MYRTSSNGDGRMSSHPGNRTVTSQLLPLLLSGAALLAGCSDSGSSSSTSTPPPSATVLPTIPGQLAPADDQPGSTTSAPQPQVPDEQPGEQPGDPIPPAQQPLTPEQEPVPQPDDEAIFGAQELERLIGELALEYYFSSIPGERFTTTVDFQASDRVEVDGGPLLASDLDDSSIACGYLTETGQYLCLQVLSSGLRAGFLFALDDSNAGTGNFHFCTPNVSDADCGEALAVTPDGVVEVQVTPAAGAFALNRQPALRSPSSAELGHMIALEQADAVLDPAPNGKWIDADSSVTRAQLARLGRLLETD